MRIIGMENNHMILGKIAGTLNGKTSNILVFLNENDFAAIPLPWWQLRNDLLPVTQYTDNNVLFSIGNPNLYFQTKKIISYTDSLYYKYLFPVNKTVVEELGCENFIKANNVKYIYVKEGIDLMEQLKSQVDTVIISDKINGSFYVLK